MPSPDSGPPSLTAKLVGAMGLVGAGLRTIAGKGAKARSAPVQAGEADGAANGAAALADACVSLDGETRALRTLLERLEDEAVHGKPILAVESDTAVVDLDGAPLLADDGSRSVDERRADLEAALRSQPCVDWEQSSPELVSIIEALSDIPGSLAADPVEPDDLKQIRGIGKVLEGFLNDQ
ncbi:MAG: hypothetical protein AAGG01_13900, partial [Planctomycetota bacterium]